MAEEAGYDPKQFTFCAAYEGFVKRVDHCPDYYSKGCESGICGFASNNSNETCYCHYQQQTVLAKLSCPYYQDFFETAIGKRLADSSSKKS